MCGGGCGVTYSAARVRAEHTVIYEESDIYKIQGSKYLASYTVEGFKKIINDAGGIVFGTPCQIAGLNNYLENRGIRDKYLLVDIFCHGVPNNIIWENHVNDIKNRYDCKDGIASFRDKKVYRLKIGEYIKDAQTEPFLHYYLTGQINRKECYTCPYRRKSLADMRLGDYYKAGDNDSYSVVVPITENGICALNEVLNFIEIYPLEYELMDSVQEKDYKESPKTRDEIFVKSEQGVPPRIIMGKKKIIFQYIKGCVKRILKFYI